MGIQLLIMSKDLKSVKHYAQLSENEIKTITSNKRPIVILKKNNNYKFPESLSPGLHNIGVMLPYSPMHYLLFDESELTFNFPNFIFNLLNEI